MNIVRGEELEKQLEWHGRVYYDSALPGVYFDWTVSSFEIHFRGTSLSAGFHVIPGKIQVKVPGKLPMQMELADQDDYPWMGVFMDGEDTPSYTFDIRQADQNYILFSSDREEEHTIRVDKLSEAKFSSIALRSLCVEGEFLGRVEGTKEQIEFVGDSITCGFGNMATEADRLFYNNEENGWLAYGPVAARALGLEPACISYSGISTAKHEMMAPYGILDLYEYSERLVQDSLGRPAQKWDFSGHPSKYVVVNLGTNDANAVMFSAGQYSESDFEEDYGKLLKLIRRCNPESVILCVLGSMDYYLYDNILRTVDRYRKETGDGKIATFKFNRMMNLGADVGGCMHPSRFRHEQMGSELADFIRGLEKNSADLSAATQ